MAHSGQLLFIFCDSLNSSQKAAACSVLFVAEFHYPDHLRYALSESHRVQGPTIRYSLSPTRLDKCRENNE